MKIPENVQRPGPQTGLIWRPITPEDLDGWYALIRRMADTDKPGWVEDRADLEHILARPGDDPALDTLLGHDSKGTVRAFGSVSANPGSGRIVGFGGVDPEWRRRGIGTAVYRWQESRARNRLSGQEKGEVVLRSFAEESNPSHVALLHSVGAKVVRYFTEMTRPLAADLPQVPLPDGMEFVDFHPDLSERFRLAHNEAFLDHWGSEPRDPESWKFTVTHPQFRADWSFAVVDTASGSFAAYQLASLDPETKEIFGYTEGYTELLGVLRKWRGRRLAPAMLSEAMRRFRQSGMEHAGLGVDTENPSGALRIYEQLGYVPVSRQITFDLPLKPDTSTG